MHTFLLDLCFSFYGYILTLFPIFFNQFSGANPPRFFCSLAFRTSLLGNCAKTFLLSHPEHLFIKILASFYFLFPGFDPPFFCHILSSTQATVSTLRFMGFRRSIAIPATLLSTLSPLHYCNTLKTRFKCCG